MRHLRECGWFIDNYKVNPPIAQDKYLVREAGIRTAHGERPPKPARTARGAERRWNLVRDRHVCPIGGVPASESCPDAPSQRAVLTIGHLTPVNRAGTDDVNSLRAECQR